MAAERGLLELYGMMTPHYTEHEYAPVHKALSKSQSSSGYPESKEMQDLEKRLFSLKIIKNMEFTNKISVPGILIQSITQKKRI